MNLERKIMDGSAFVAIIGLGYVGLPLLVTIAESGYGVIGIDIDKTKVKKLAEGSSYIEDIDDDLIKSISDKAYYTDSFDNVNAADIIIICVPTPLDIDREPDLSYVSSAVKSITEKLDPGKMIILESTTYPGYTREMTDYISEVSGLKIGKELYGCFSPERVDPRNKVYNIKNTPKVIGGYTERCRILGASFYSRFVDEVVSVSSLETAEMSKLLENTFRSVNIALINELTMLSDRLDINIWEVINAAKTKPFGFMSFYPNIGVGGHCLPIDPTYLSWKAKKEGFESDFIDLSIRVNTGMTKYAIKDIEEKCFNDGLSGKCILVVGVGYKKDTADIRESPSIRLIESLVKHGVDVSFYDPYVDKITIGGTNIVSRELNHEVLCSMDLVIIATPHSCIDYDYIIDRAPLIYDTKNIMKRAEDIITFGE